MFNKIKTSEVVCIFNKNLLKSEVFKKGYNLTSFADRLGMNRATFFRKMRLGNFGSIDIQRIMQALEILDPVPIFFAPDLTSQVITGSESTCTVDDLLREEE